MDDAPLFTPSRLVVSASLSLDQRTVLIETWLEDENGDRYDTTHEWLNLEWSVFRLNRVIADEVKHVVAAYAKAHADRYHDPAPF